ncbi:MFS transporter [Paracoccus zhejiangensis]|uniref:MFS transporter n=1 Tax=Paracoccus zhejiangensis TaxID=1077935 RepID=A0A2H5EYP6_9RHOB|nr:MFS transporter [Paracoccus zhejiangensis]AUH64407.1 MFS transporter [Paracoccus zhejiangensis]
MTETEFPESKALRHDPRALALLLAASLTVMAAATISPALPGLERQFPDTAANAWLIRLLVPAPSLAVILTAALCGIAAERIGRRPLLLTGITLFALAGSAGLVLQDLNHMLASRLVLGVALALIMTAQSALLGDYFSGAALHALSGAQVAARNFGGFAFITLAGALASLSARLPFAIYALPTLVLPFMARAITEPPRRIRGDRIATDPAAAPGWGLGVGLLSLGQMLVTTIFFTMPTQLPFYLEVRGYAEPALTGAVLGVLMIAGGISALFYPRLRARIGNLGNWAIGLALMALGFALLVSGSDIATIGTAAAAIGAGYALTIPGFTALSLQHSPAHRRGTMAAMLTASVFLGQFLSPLLSIPAIAHWGWQASGLGLAGLLAAAALVPAAFALRSGRS